MAKVIVAPGWLPPVGSAEGVPDALPLLAGDSRFTRARVRRVELEPSAEMSSVPLWLGMVPGEGELAPGPLRVAALGWDPPEPSTHLCLDLLSLDSEEKLRPAGSLKSLAFAELREITAPLFSDAARRLEGRSGADALVLTGRDQSATIAPEMAIDQPLRSVMPEGPRILSQIVDDSANLLIDSDLNKYRAEEGLPPISLLWPWGSGWRESVPNLALRFGGPLSLVGGGEEIRGLARLAGLRPGAPDEIVILPSPAATDDPDEMQWRLREEALPALAGFADDEGTPTAIILTDTLRPTQALWLGFLPNHDGDGEIRREMIEERSVSALPLPAAIGAFFVRSRSSL